MSDTLTPTSGRDWRKVRKEPVLTTLPYSGYVVELAHIQLDQLILAGKIPDHLSPVAADMIWVNLGQGKAISEVQAEKKFYELVDFVVGLVLTNPRIVENPTEDDEIAIGDIDFADKIFIYNIATQPLEVLHRFRAGQGPNVEPVQQGEDIQPPTE